MTHRNRKETIALLLGLFVCVLATAHTIEQPSIHDVVAAVQERLATKFPIDVLNKLTQADVLNELSPQEREILATGLLRFTANQPVTVVVLHDKRFTSAQPMEPFWLDERGFKKTNLEVHCGSELFSVFIKDFDPGVVGLGVNSFSGANEQYFVAVKPRMTDTPLELSDFYPAYVTTSILEPGARPYTHPSWDPITQVPLELSGLTLVQVDPAWRRATRLTGVYTETIYGAGSEPDQIILTWSDDPSTTQTIQWRTSVKVPSGALAYIKKADFNTFSRKEPLIVPAESSLLRTPRVVNDPEVYRHTVRLHGLEPNTTYLYAVGDGTGSHWTELREFTTAPHKPMPFSFVYMGDVQNGFERWRSLIRRVFRERPDAAFYILAGDLVNRGNDRDDWDDFFFNARDVLDKRPLVPALGNHEYQNGPPVLYQTLFTLPQNGPAGVPPEHVYSFIYSNALFVILDSNQPPETQTEWLDRVLGNTDAVWKFVIFHHPIYSSSPRRDNPWLREAWVPIFDRHQVDMVLQGHDHAYLRTGPMKNNEPVKDGTKATMYVVSVAGTKLYEQKQHDYTAVGFVNTSTYQVLDIQLQGNRLVYRALDNDGRLMDEIIIQK